MAAAASQIQAYLKQLAADYPSLVELQNIGTSYEGRDMTVIRVSVNGGKSPRLGRKLRSFV